VSYCRWNSGDLYIYADVHGGITCCGCKLLRPSDGGDWQDFNCATRSEMIAHIEQHRIAGHRVLNDVITLLREEIGTRGDAANPD
jgi:hypothetical protein